MLQRKVGRKVSGTINKHLAHSIGFYFHSDYNDLIPSKFDLYRETDPIKWFFMEVKKLACEIDTILRTTNGTAIMTPHNWQEFRSVDKCYLCWQPISAENYKILEHCQLSRLYWGTAHVKCNFFCVDSISCQSFFTTLQNMHFLIRDMVKILNGQIDVITKNTETYLNVSVKLTKSEIKLIWLIPTNFLLLA